LFGYVLQGNTREEKSSEFGYKEKGIHLEGQQSRIRKLEPRPARMLLFRKLGPAAGGGLLVGPYSVKVFEGNSRKGITREEKHCKKFSQWIAFGRKKG